MSSAKKADMSKLDSPAWLKANHQARTEPCAGLNNVALFEPKGKSNREYKLNLNEGAILCLLDNQRRTK